MLNTSDIQKIQNFYAEMNNFLEEHDAFYLKNHLYIDGNLEQNIIHVDTMYYNVHFFDIDAEPVQHLEFELYDFDWSEFLPYTGESAEKTPLALLKFVPPEKSAQIENQVNQFNDAVQGSFSTHFEMTAHIKMLGSLLPNQEDIFYQWNEELSLTYSLTQSMTASTILYFNPDEVFPIE